MFELLLLLSSSTGLQSLCCTKSFFSMNVMLPYQYLSYYLFILHALDTILRDPEQCYGQKQKMSMSLSHLIPAAMLAAFDEDETEAAWKQLESGIAVYSDFLTDPSPAMKSRVFFCHVPLPNSHFWLCHWIVDLYKNRYLCWQFIDLHIMAGNVFVS